MTDVSASPSSSRRRIVLRTVVALLAALVLVVGAGLAWLTWNDWNRSRAWVSAQVTDAIGRPFAINGPLSLDWQWPYPAETGWRRWIPTPIVNAGDVLVGNPDGFAARGPHFAHVGQASAEIALWPLLGRREAPR